MCKYSGVVSYGESFVERITLPGLLLSSAFSNKIQREPILAQNPVNWKYSYICEFFFQ